MIERISAYLRMIRFSHSIFALPFAFTAALIAKEGLPSLRQALWIAIAMVSARSGAMGINRIIDRRIDLANPRTAIREIPQGKISVEAAMAFSIISFAMLVFAAYMLNPLCLKLAPIAVAAVVLYSYTKRITWLSHIALGIAISGSTVGAWIAVRGSFTADILPLALSVVFWIAGFDILYALQDIEFDRSHGLYSIPLKFGIKNSLLMSRILHTFTLCLLGLTGFIFSLGVFFWIGLLVAAMLFIYEHSILRHNDLSRLDTAFFNMNGYISVTVFASTFLNYLFNAAHP